jgi:Raf kinase inhibitor-like YbhB/YbcL family protein
MLLTSASFPDQGEIPTRYTCEGEDVSPPLAWSQLPAATKALALIMDDPDAPDPKAPRMVFVHWVLYNIPASAAGLPEAAKKQTLPKGTCEGLNDWQRPGYGGPCPPVGRHRYFFKLYALDSELSKVGEPTKARVEAAMKGHLLGQVQIVGTYEKKRK